MPSRFFGASGPGRPSLVRPGGGLSAELFDLRRDIEGAFSALDAEASSSYRDVRWVDGTTTLAVSEQDGSFARPFSTIQAALDDIGPPVDVADAGRQIIVAISPGRYDEDLVIPPNRQLFLFGTGVIPIWNLGGGTSAGNVTIANDANLPFDPIESPLFVLTGDINGDLFLSNGGTAIDTFVIFLQATVGGGICGTAYTPPGGLFLAFGSFLVPGLIDNSVVSNVDCPSAVVVGHTVTFGASVNVGGFGPMHFATFNGPVTVQLGFLNLGTRVGGFEHCTFSSLAPLTSPAIGPIDVPMDAYTNGIFKAAGLSLAPNLVKVILDDLVP